MNYFRFTNFAMNKLTFPFTKINAYIILGGLTVVLFGYILMSGGGSADPNTFNAEELFSARRITVAPIVVLLGYITIGVGIMYRGENLIKSLKRTVLALITFIALFSLILLFKTNTPDNVESVHSALANKRFQVINDIGGKTTWDFNSDGTQIHLIFEFGGKVVIDEQVKVLKVNADSFKSEDGKFSYTVKGNEITCTESNKEIIILKETTK